MDTHMRLKGCALSTTKCYLRAVAALIDHLGKLPEACSVDEIKSHLVWVRDELNLSSSALNTHVCGIKYYFREVAHRLDLVVKIPNPRLQKYVTAVLTEEEMASLFRCCRDSRQLAMLQVFYDTGIRVRELTGIRLGDFDKTHRILTIRNGKGKKIRTLPYSEALRTGLTRYFRSLDTPPKEWLFESYGNSGNPMSNKGIQNLVREIAKRSGIKKDIHPHTFRHTFAVHYLNNGGSLLRLKELLGHAHLTTTFNYLKYCNIPLNDCPTPLQVWTKNQQP